MQITTIGRVLIASSLFLSGCSFTEEVLWPLLTGVDPRGAAETAPPQPQAGPAIAQAGAVQPASPAPALGNGDFQPEGVTPGEPTGTEVGRMVSNLREELKQLQAKVRQDNTQLQAQRAKMVQGSARYHGTVAAMNARLQVGTTPGNPILVQQFSGAQGNLEQLSENIAQMNQLASTIGATSTRANFLSNTARSARSITGAVDEDHRQLAILEDEVDRTVVLIQRLLKEVSDDVRRQTAYLAVERTNLNVLAAAVKTGEIYGQSLANVPQPIQASASVPSSDIAGRRPLLVIRFDRPDVPYQQALYNAVSRALEARPSGAFDLVAVAATNSNTGQNALNANRARRSAESVMRSLVEMGLPQSRVVLSNNASTAVRDNEVHLYIR
ncbi:MAG: hypothetical protein O3A88_04965 [Proteobacteria bacterium]|nr:hypothetical protein [Pseudomonadota bacterium]